MRKHRAPLRLSVQYAVAADDLPARHLLRRWIIAVQEKAADVTLRFVGATEARALNRTYRRKNYPTNVLTFVYDVEGGVLRGDIVLCAPLLRREAAEQGKSLAAHCAHLVVHGMLHLQGYDHERAADAARMEALEVAALARMGFPDPYAFSPGSAS